MPLNYYTLQPDEVYLVKGNHTIGRQGLKPTHVTRHHLAYIGNGRDVVNNIWNHPTHPRAASAHHVIGPKGWWTQTVWDMNTAWADASGWSNPRSDTIEHSNDTGAPGWTISDETIIKGARVAAAYLLHRGNGRPVFGKNVKDHRDVSELGTSCPFHLANGGKYHNHWMEESTWFYDQLDKKLVNPDGTPLKTKFPPVKLPVKEDIMATDFNTETTAMDGSKHTYGQLLRYTDNRIYNLDEVVIPKIIKKQEDSDAREARIEAKLDKLLALTGLDKEAEGTR